MPGLTYNNISRTTYAAQTLDYLFLGLERESLYNRVRVNQDCRAKENIKIIPEKPKLTRHTRQKKESWPLGPHPEADTHDCDGNSSHNDLSPDTWCVPTGKEHQTVPGASAWLRPCY